MRAAAGRVEHSEVEKLTGSGNRVVIRDEPDLVEVALKRRQDRLAYQMLHRRHRRAIDATGLATALVGLPQQPPRNEFRLVGIGDMPVLPEVVAQRTICHGELQVQQRLVSSRRRRGTGRMAE